MIGGLGMKKENEIVLFETRDGDVRLSIML